MKTVFPFKKIEFGNPEQIHFLRKQAEAEGDVYACPNMDCDAHSEDENSSPSDFATMVEDCEDGRTYYVCGDCEAVFET